MSVVFIYKMASVGVLCLTKSFSALNIHSSPWNASLRFISRKVLFEKLQIPEKPKKPMGPFFAFANVHRNDVTKENPNLRITEIAKKLGGKWIELSPEEKQIYKDKFREDYVKYKIALKHFEESLTEEQMNEINQAVNEVTALKEKNILRKLKFDKLREFNKPKCPLNAFARFMKSQDREGRKIPQFWKEMSIKWKTLPFSEKEKYYVEYEKEKLDYLKNLEDWEREMVEKGNFDIVRTRTVKNKLKKSKI